MSDRYSVYDDGFGMEVNTYYLTRDEAIKMAGELLEEGAEEVTIVNMEDYIKKQEAMEATK